MKAPTTGLSHPLVWCGVVAFTLLFLSILHAIWWLMLPAVLAVVLYYVSESFVTWLKQRGLDHGQAIWAYIGLVTLFTFCSIPVVIPWLTNEAARFQEAAPEYMAAAQNLIDKTVDMLDGTSGNMGDQPIAEKLAFQLDRVISTAIKEHIPDIVKFFLSWIPSMLLVPYLCFFFLRDGTAFKKLLLRGVPNAFFEKVLLLIHNIDAQIRQYFRGLMGLTLLDGITLTLGLWLLGFAGGNMGEPDVFPFSQALLLGFLCAVLSWVPYAGSIAGGMLVLWVCLVNAPDNGWLAVGTVVLFCVVRLLDDFVYTPVTIGKSLHVHPLLTVIMIFAGGVIAEVPGLLLAMPALGVSMVLGDIIGQVWMDERLQARHRHARHLRRLRAQEDLI
jgi:predicted PurR-regulated permease PerM